MDKVPALSLTDADALFLDFMATQFPCNLAFAVLSGTNAEINSVLNHFAGTPAIDPRRYDPTGYRGPLRDIVAVACKAYADAQSAMPMTMLDRLYAHWKQNRQVRYQAEYAKYFA